MSTTPLTSDFDVAVIGGGAAGLAASGFCARSGLRTVLIEKNRQTGRKLAITGKGRCNVTNDCTREELLENVPVNPKFLYAAVSSFGPADTMRLFESLGVELKVERGRRVFPVSDCARDIVSALNRYSSGAVRVHAAVESVHGAGTGFELRLRGRCFETIRARAVLICTGGVSYPATGSTGDGYRFAAGFGHTVIPPKPSLVPLVSDDPFCAQCMGLSLKNTGVAFYRGEKRLYAEQGEMLFTHFGVSGPVILSSSAHLRSFPVTMRLDLKPALDEKTLDRRVTGDLAGNSNRLLQNSLDRLLPMKLIHPFIMRTGLDPEKRSRDITRAERGVIVALLKRLEIKVTGTRPVSEAIVTSGGVSVRELKPATMESKIVRGLFFAGEVIDVDAYTGGYNLLIAFSTARAAARGVISYINEG